MRQNITLTIVSLLTLVLLSVHFVHDVMHGVEPPRAIINMSVILVVWTAVTVLLMGRIAGYILLFLGFLGAAGMPVIHTMNATTLKYQGEFSFYWTLAALGVTGGLGAILAAIGLWKSIRARSIPASQTKVTG